MFGNTVDSGENYRKFTGFTLAEVLITLGIIGVVAAMTLPSVIHNYKIKSLETSFKKSYSLLSQALLKMKADDLYLEKQTGNYYYFNDTFSKYFKTIEKYNTNTYDLKILNYKTSSFRDPSDTIDFSNGGHGHGAFILNNGAIIFNTGSWWSSDTAYIEFMIDTNGTKAPNRLGYDVFYFQIVHDNKLLPSDQAKFNDTRPSSANCCNFSTSNKCYLTDNGCACAYYALKDRNPQDETKGYWESLK